jgi:penicillin amidase
MPQAVNPPQGYVLTANNDPIGITLDNNLFNKHRAGGGIYYFGTGYSSLRAGQISRLLTGAISAKGKLGGADLRAMQENNQLLDAAFFQPHILAAFANANAAGAPAPLAALGADPGIAEAVGRLRAWDFSTPTGVLDGYDPGRDPASFPTAAQVSNSVAATIYTIWRGQFVAGVLDATLTKVGLGSYTPDDDHALRALRQLLVDFPAGQGVGASGLNFFEGTGPGLSSPADARDLLILQSLRQALDQLAGDAYADAFGNSTSQKSYRWGKLHRIVFSSVLGGPFNIPGGGDFTDYSPLLPGLAKGGGYETIDAASFGVRGASPNDFMFGSGPARRFVGDLLPGAIDAQEIIPGGESGVVGSPDRANQLGRWLTNQYHQLLITSQQVLAGGGIVTHFLPVS